MASGPSNINRVFLRFLICPRETEEKYDETLSIGLNYGFNDVAKCSKVDTNLIHT